MFTKSPKPVVVQDPIVPLETTIGSINAVWFTQIVALPMDIISGIGSAETTATAAVSEQAPAKTIRRK